MSKYFEKKKGISNKKLNTEIELGKIDMLKSSDDFLSPYFDEFQKQEDFHDQFVAVVQNQKEGKEKILINSLLGVLNQGYKKKELRETPEQIHISDYIKPNVW